MSSIARISQRITDATSLTKCPGCGLRVVVRGEGCPACTFPIARYQIRIKWFRTLFAGLIVLAVALFLLFANALGDLRGVYGLTVKLLGIAGLVATAVGAIGVIFGGLHVAGQSRSSSGWQLPRVEADSHPDS